MSHDEDNRSGRRPWWLPLGFSAATAPFGRAFVASSKLNQKTYVQGDPVEKTYTNLVVLFRLMLFYRDLGISRTFWDHVQTDWGLALHSSKDLDEIVGYYVSARGRAHREGDTGCTTLLTRLADAWFHSSKARIERDGLRDGVDEIVWSKRRALWKVLLRDRLNIILDPNVKTIPIDTHGIDTRDPPTPVSFQGEDAIPPLADRISHEPIGVQTTSTGLPRKRSSSIENSEVPAKRHCGAAFVDIHQMQQNLITKLQAQVIDLTDRLKAVEAQVPPPTEGFSEQAQGNAVVSDTEAKQTGGGAGVIEELLQRLDACEAKVAQMQELERQALDVHSGVEMTAPRLEDNIAKINHLAKELPTPVDDPDTERIATEAGGIHEQLATTKAPASHDHSLTAQSLAANLEQTQSQLTLLSGRVSELSGKVDGLDERIDEHDNEFSDVQASIRTQSIAIANAAIKQPPAPADRAMPDHAAVLEAAYNAMEAVREYYKTHDFSCDDSARTHFATVVVHSEATYNLLTRGRTT